MKKILSLCFLVCSLTSSLFASQAAEDHYGNDDAIDKPLTQLQKNKLIALTNFLRAYCPPIFSSLTPFQEEENAAYNARRTTLGFPPYLSRDFILKKYHNGKILDPKSFTFLMNYEWVQKIYIDNDEGFVNINNDRSETRMDVFKRLLQHQLVPPHILLDTAIKVNGEPTNLFDYVLKEALQSNTINSKASSPWQAVVKFYTTPRSSKEIKNFYKTYEIQYQMREKFVKRFFQGYTKILTQIEDNEWEVHGVCRNALWHIKDNPVIFYHAAQNFTWVKELNEVIKKRASSNWYTRNLFTFGKISTLFEYNLIENVYTYIQQLLELHQAESITDNFLQIIENPHTLMDRKKKESTEKIVNQLKALIELHTMPFLEALLLDPKKHMACKEIAQIQKVKKKKEIQKMRKTKELQNIVLTLEGVLKKKGVSAVGFQGDPLNTMENYFFSQAQSHPQRKIYPWQVVPLLRKLDNEKSQYFKYNAQIIYLISQEDPYKAFQAYYIHHTEAQKKELLFAYYAYLQKEETEIPLGYVRFLKAAFQEGINYLPKYFFENPPKKNPAPHLIMALAPLKKISENKLKLDNPPKKIIRIIPINRLDNIANLFDEEIDITNKKDILLNFAKSNPKHLAHLLDWWTYRYDPIIAMDMEEIEEEINPQNPNCQNNLKKWHDTLRKAQADFQKKDWWPYQNPFEIIEKPQKKGNDSYIVSTLKIFRRVHAEFDIFAESPKLALTYQNEKKEDLLLILAQKGSLQAFQQICDLYRKQGIQIWDRYDPQNLETPNPLMIKILKPNEKGKFCPDQDSRRKFKYLQTIFKEEKKLEIFFNHLDIAIYDRTFNNTFKFDTLLCLNPIQRQVDKSVLFFEELTDKATLQEKKEALKRHFQAHWALEEKPDHLKDDFYNELVRSSSFGEVLFQKSSRDDPNAPLYITLLEKLFTLNWQKAYPKIKPYYNFLLFSIEKAPKLLPYFLEKYKTDPDFRSYVGNQVMIKKGNKGEDLYENFDSKSRKAPLNPFEHAINFAPIESLIILMENRKDIPLIHEKGNPIARRDQFWKSYSDKTDPTTYLEKLQYYNQRTKMLKTKPFFLNLSEEDGKSWHTQPDLPIVNYLPSPYYSDLLYLFKALQQDDEALAIQYIKEAHLDQLTIPQKEHLCATLLAYPYLHSFAIDAIVENEQKNAVTFLFEKLDLEEINFFTLFAKYPKSALLQKKAEGPYFETLRSFLNFLAKYNPKKQNPYLPYDGEYIFTRYPYVLTIKVNQYFIEGLYAAKDAPALLNQWKYYGTPPLEFWEENSIHMLFAKGKSFLELLMQRKIIIVNEIGWGFFMASGFLEALAQQGTLQQVKTFFKVYKKVFSKYEDIAKIAKGDLHRMQIMTLTRNDEEKAQEIYAYIKGLLNQSVYFIDEFTYTQGYFRKELKKNPTLEPKLEQYQKFYKKKEDTIKASQKSLLEKEVNYALRHQNNYGYVDLDLEIPKVLLLALFVVQTLCFITLFPYLLGKKRKAPKPLKNNTKATAKSNDKKHQEENPNVKKTKRKPLPQKEMHA